MGSTVSIIAALIIITFIGTLIEKGNSEKRKLRFLKKQYGQKPLKETYDFTQTKMYFTESADKDEHVVDDETWDDLDMDDVFERLNATLSFAGEQSLYKALRNLSHTPHELIDRERKMRFLQEENQERIQIQKELMGIGKHPSSYYVPMFFNNMETFRIDYIWIYRVLQILLVAGILISAFLQNQWIIMASGGLFLVNICIYAASKNKYEINLEVVAGMYRTLKALQMITQKKGIKYTKKFPETKENLEPVQKALKYFKLILGRNTGVSNDFVETMATYITGAFLLDFTVYDKLIGFMINEREQFHKVYACAGELDMLIAIASFRQSLPFYTTPEFSDVELAIDMQEIFHPLLEHPVCNSVRLNKNTIITGSNASGKSTFIKAVVINQIFAQSIHTCTAKRIVLPFSEVKTSMAVRDRILEGESYYMREIKSLKRTVDSVSGEKPVLCAVDEILRGTNTRERLAASAAVIRYMQQKNCIVIIATHDMELLSLIEQGAYEYYYFSEREGETDIMFDYMIREGISKETNAIKLLAKIGFPPTIIEEAQSICAEYV